MFCVIQSCAIFTLLEHAKWGGAFSKDLIGLWAFSTHFTITKKYKNNFKNTIMCVVILIFWNYQNINDVVQVFDPAGSHNCLVYT